MTHLRRIVKETGQLGYRNSLSNLRMSRSASNAMLIVYCLFV